VLIRRASPVLLPGLDGDRSGLGLARLFMCPRGAGGCSVGAGHDPEPGLCLLKEGAMFQRIVEAASLEAEYGRGIHDAVRAVSKCNGQAVAWKNG
jgi:hypothetical protein